MRERLMFCAVLALAFGCEKAPSDGATPAAKTGVDGAAAAGKTPSEAAKPGAGARPTADPGPTLKRVTGKRPMLKVPPMTLSIDSWQVTGDAAYVRVDMPDDPTKLPKGNDLEARLIVKGDRYGLAVPVGLGRTSDRAAVLVRFVGAEPPPKQFELEWRQPANRNGLAGQTQLLTVSGMKDARPGVELEARFFESASRWFRYRGSFAGMRSAPFYTFAAGRLQAMGQGLKGSGSSPLGRSRRGDVGEMMAFFTGMTSVEEALQIDRGLRTPPDTSPARVHPLASVEAVKLPGHPWDELIARSSMGPQIEPLAAWAPDDMFYAHFTDLAAMARVADDMDRFLAPAARVAEAKAGESRFIKRYERQLAVQRSAMTKVVGGAAAKGVALVSSDPFFREGTDVSLLFLLNQPGLLEAALDGYARAAKTRRPDLERSTYMVGEVEVQRLATSDRVVLQHRFRVGNVVCISNSRAAVERILATQTGTVRALSKSGDFRYFRAVYPHSKTAEEAFIFVSDLFVNHVIGPRTKVLQARRTAAQADLVAVNNAMLLHGWLSGAAPTDTKALLASGVLIAADLKHDDGSGAISFSKARGAYSAAWGSVQELTPLIGAPIDKVTEREKGAYGRFRETYQSYWKGFIDPIGIRISRRGDGGLDLDARMMPLIGRSDYQELEEMVGDKRLAVGAVPEGLRFVFAVAERSKFRREIDQLGRTMLGSRDIGLGWLGDWVMIGVADRSGIWDAFLASEQLGSATLAGESASREARKAVYNRLPLYVGAHIKSKLALAATLTAVKGFVMSVVPGAIKWGKAAPYKGTETVVITENIDGEGNGVSIYYGIVRDVLLVAVDRGTLEQQIDGVLAGEVPALQKPKAGAKKAKQLHTDSAQSILSYRPAAVDGWLNRTLLGELEVGISRANRAAFRGFEALSVGLATTENADKLGSRALAMTGQVPTSPNGGRFSVDSNGVIAHSIYGSMLEPVWPELPIENTPVSALFETLSHLQFTVSFDGEGVARGLHTTMQWQKR